jgi:2',3'-cyclic-nucleotide 2'-phosphodiesterase (5'-nucleotidase family)
MTTLIIDLPRFLSISLMAMLVLGGCGLNTRQQPASAEFMLINDVYRIGGLQDGDLGGLAKVRTLRRKEESRRPGLILLHAGDALFPSLLSRKYNGEQMVDVLNLLDGAAERFDHALFVTLGNHEFDKAKMKHAPLFEARMEESDFTWLSANVEFQQLDNQQQVVDSERLQPSALIERNGLKIGIFGVTIDSKIPEYVASIDDPIATARKETGRLRKMGADLVVALTHLPLNQDQEILRQLGGDGPDVIFGGHEHHRQMVQVDGRYIFKADADAVSALVASVTPREGKPPLVSYQYRELDRSIAPDPLVQRRVDRWLARHDASVCASRKEESGCLDLALGFTNVPLIAEELQIRGQESNLGNWVTDQALAAFRDQGAQIAFLNSGSLRLNQNLAAGTEITRRHLEELFAYPSPLHLIRIDGKTLHQVINHSITGWPGEGRWLQVAGFAWMHDTDKGIADGLTLLTDQGPKPILPDDSLLAVVNQFLIDPAIGDQDGYRMLKMEDRLAVEAAPPDLKELVIAALKSSIQHGISPAVEGRICAIPAPDGQPCLALSPL